MSQILTYVVESLRGCDDEALTRCAAETGINKWSLIAIKKGEKHGTKNPGILTIEPLWHYFQRLEGRKLRRKAA